MELKKNPEADLTKARPSLFMVGAVVALAFTLMAWEYTKFTKTIVENATSDVEMVEEEIVAVYTPPPPPKETPPPPQLDIIEIVEDEEDVVETLELIPIDESEEIELFEAPAEEAVQEQIFTVVEQMPEFKGGNEALMEYLGENIKYPSIAKENNIQGKVYVEFTVHSDGSITDVGLKEDYDIGGGCGKEAIRVVEGMPRWTPGEQRGVPVSVRMVLPVTFKLKG